MSVSVSEKPDFLIFLPQVRRKNAIDWLIDSPYINEIWCMLTLLLQYRRPTSVWKMWNAAATGWRLQLSGQNSEYCNECKRIRRDRQLHWDRDDDALSGDNRWWSEWTNSGDISWSTATKWRKTANCVAVLPTDQRRQNDEWPATVYYCASPLITLHAVTRSHSFTK